MFSLSLETKGSGNNLEFGLYQFLIVLFITKFVNSNTVNILLNRFERYLIFTKLKIIDNNNNTY